MVEPGILVPVILVRLRAPQPMKRGCLAQLARASALHAEGQEFKSLNIHQCLFSLAGRASDL